MRLYPTLFQRIFRRRAIRNRRLKLRFMLTGAISTTVDWGLLFGLHLFGLPAIGANFISTTAGFCVSFVMNKNFTFRTKGANVGREILQYIAFTLIGIWIFQPAVIILAQYLLQPHIANQTIVLAIGKIL
ncbi:MAG TPA: GtrA family protein, partial [Candidatus Saccharimonadaceae bacterium]|nr:GtrA family protein [Candidatus Saccharimonadaceae bacterium]